MNTLLFIPALLLGFPMVIGVWIAAMRFYTFLANRTKNQTAFVVTLCVMAAVLSLMTAPAWLIGWQGYAVVCAVYVVFVAVGAPHVFRVLRFLAIELDSDPNNDVPLPEGDAVKKDEKPVDGEKK